MEISQGLISRITDKILPEVNDVFRKNPELSREYVKKRDELRAQKGLTHQTAPKKPTPPKR